MGMGSTYCGNFFMVLGNDTNFSEISMVNTKSYFWYDLVQYYQFCIFSIFRCED